MVIPISKKSLQHEIETLLDSWDIQYKPTVLDQKGKYVFYDIKFRDHCPNIKDLIMSMQKIVLKDFIIISSLKTIILNKLDERQDQKVFEDQLQLGL